MRQARNILRAVKTQTFEFKGLLFKKVLNESFFLQHKIYFLLLGLFPKFSASIRYKSNCFITFKPRSVFSKFKLNRVPFRELTAFGALYPVKKANW